MVSCVQKSNAAGLFPKHLTHLLVKIAVTVFSSEIETKMSLRPVFLLLFLAGLAFCQQLICHAILYNPTGWIREPVNCQGACFLQNISYPGGNAYIGDCAPPGLCDQQHGEEVQLGWKEFNRSNYLIAEGLPEGIQSVRMMTECCNNRNLCNSLPSWYFVRSV